MKKTLYLLIVLVLLGASLAACQAAKPLTIEAQDAGKTFTIKNGETLVVELEGNITTGYNWVPAAQDPALLVRVLVDDVTPQSDAIGAPGIIVLTFRAIGTGQTVLHLDYMRPWETDVEPIQTFEVTIIVTD